MGGRVALRRGAGGDAGAPPSGPSLLHLPSRPSRATGRPRRRPAGTDGLRPTPDPTTTHAGYNLGRRSRRRGAASPRRRARRGAGRWRPRGPARPRRPRWRRWTWSECGMPPPPGHLAELARRMHTARRVHNRRHASGRRGGASLKPSRAEAWAWSSFLAFASALARWSTMFPLSAPPPGRGPGLAGPPASRLPGPPRRRARWHLGPGQRRRLPRPPPPRRPAGRRG